MHSYPCHPFAKTESGKLYVFTSTIYPSLISMCGGWVCKWWLGVWVLGGCISNFWVKDEKWWICNDAIGGYWNER